MKTPNQKARKDGCVIIYGLKYNLKGFKLKTESEVFTAHLEVYVFMSYRQAEMTHWCSVCSDVDGDAVHLVDNLDSYSRLWPQTMSRL